MFQQARFAISLESVNTASRGRPFPRSFKLANAMIRVQSSAWLLVVACGKAIRSTWLPVQKLPYAVRSRPLPSWFAHPPSIHSLVGTVSFIPGPLKCSGSGTPGCKTFQRLRAYFLSSRSLFVYVLLICILVTCLRPGRNLAGPPTGSAECMCVCFSAPGPQARLPGNPLTPPSLFRSLILIHYHIHIHYQRKHP